MSNDFQGDVKDFAMVVPVPTVLKREDIRVSEAALFKKLDEYSGPRLVEYYDENPCEPRIYYDLVEMAAPMSEVQSISMKSIRRGNNLGVKIEAQYEVEEYDILILSAKRSAGLKTWLIENGYKIPESAEEVLDPYIKNNLKFFVVKVDVEKHENEFVEGAVNFLNNNKILMYLETKDKNLLSKLKKMNFEINFPKFVEGKYFFTDNQSSHHVILKNY